MVMDSGAQLSENLAQAVLRGTFVICPDAGHVVTIGNSSPVSCYIRSDQLSAALVPVSTRGATVRFPSEGSDRVEAVAAAVVLSDELCMAVPHVVFRCTACNDSDEDTYVLGRISRGNFHRSLSFRLSSSLRDKSFVRLVDGPRVIAVSLPRTDVVRLAQCGPPRDGQVDVAVKDISGRFIPHGDSGVLVVGPDSWSFLWPQNNMVWPMPTKAIWAKTATCACSLSTGGSTRAWIGTSNSKLVAISAGRAMKWVLRSSHTLAATPSQLLVAESSPGTCLIAVLCCDGTVFVFTSSDHEGGTCVLVQTITGAVGLALGDFAATGSVQIMVNALSSRGNGTIRVTVLADAVRSWTYRSVMGLDANGAAASYAEMCARSGSVDAITGQEDKQRKKRKKRRQKKAANDSRKVSKHSSPLGNMSNDEGSLARVGTALNYCLSKGLGNNLEALRVVREKVLLLQRLEYVANCMSTDVNSTSTGIEDTWGTDLVPLMAEHLGAETSKRQHLTPSCARALPLVRLIHIAMRLAEGYLLYAAVEITNPSAQSMNDLSLSFSATEGNLLQSQSHCLRILGPGSRGVISSFVTLAPNTILRSYRGSSDLLLCGNVVKEPPTTAALELYFVLSWSWSESADDRVAESQLIGSVISIPHEILLSLAKRAVTPSSFFRGKDPGVTMLNSTSCTFPRRWRLPLFLRSRTTDLTTLVRTWDVRFNAPESLVAVCVARRSAECFVSALSPLELEVFLHLLSLSLPHDVDVFFNVADSGLVEMIGRATQTLRDEVRRTSKPLLARRTTLSLTTPKALWWLDYIGLQRRVDLVFAELAAVRAIDNICA